MFKAEVLIRPSQLALAYVVSFGTEGCWAVSTVLVVESKLIYPQMGMSGQRLTRHPWVRHTLSRKAW